MKANEVDAEIRGVLDEIHQIAEAAQESSVAVFVIQCKFATSEKNAQSGKKRVYYT